MAAVSSHSHAYRPDWWGYHWTQAKHTWWVHRRTIVPQQVIPILWVHLSDIAHSRQVQSGQSANAHLLMIHFTTAGTNSDMHVRLVGLDGLEDIGVGSGQKAIALCQQLLLVKAAGPKARSNHAVGLSLSHAVKVSCGVVRTGHGQLQSDISRQTGYGMSGNMQKKLWLMNQHRQCVGVGQRRFRGAHAEPGYVNITVWETTCARRQCLPSLSVQRQIQ